MFVITLKDSSFIFGENYDARVIFPFIFIKESHKNNKALIEHEKTHIKQMFQLRGLLYYFSKEMRYKLELEAYQQQLYFKIKEFQLTNPNKQSVRLLYERLTDIYSTYMQDKYNLPIGTYQRAKKDLLSNIDKI